LDQTFRTAAWSSATTSRLVLDRSAATATDRASFTAQYELDVVAEYDAAATGEKCGEVDAGSDDRAGHGRGAR